MAPVERIKNTNGESKDPQPNNTKNLQTTSSSEVIVDAEPASTNPPSPDSSSNYTTAHSSLSRPSLSLPPNFRAAARDDRAESVLRFGPARSRTVEPVARATSPFANINTTQRPASTPAGGNWHIRHRRQQQQSATSQKEPAVRPNRFERSRGNLTVPSLPTQQGNATSEQPEQRTELREQAESGNGAGSQ